MTYLLRKCACGFEGVDLWFLKLGRNVPAGTMTHRCRKCQLEGKRDRTVREISPIGHKIAAAKIGIPFDEYMRHVLAGKKWCGRCDRWKTRSAFRVHRSAPGGRDFACRRCLKQAHAAKVLIRSLDTHREFAHG